MPRPRASVPTSRLPHLRASRPLTFSPETGMNSPLRPLPPRGGRRARCSRPQPAGRPRARSPRPPATGTRGSCRPLLPRAGAGLRRLPLSLVLRGPRGRRRERGPGTGAGRAVARTRLRGSRGHCGPAWLGRGRDSRVPRPATREQLGLRSQGPQRTRHRRPPPALRGTSPRPTCRPHGVCGRWAWTVGTSHPAARTCRRAALPRCLSVGVGQVGARAEPLKGCVLRPLPEGTALCLLSVRSRRKQDFNSSSPRGTWPRCRASPGPAPRLSAAAVPPKRSSTSTFWGAIRTVSGDISHSSPESETA